MCVQPPGQCDSEEGNQPRERSNHPGDIPLTPHPCLCKKDSEQTMVNFGSRGKAIRKDQYLQFAMMCFFCSSVAFSSHSAMGHEK